jgi:hypothetical protein
MNPYHVSVSVGRSYGLREVLFYFIFDPVNMAQFSTDQQYSYAHREPWSPFSVSLPFLLVSFFIRLSFYLHFSNLHLVGVFPGIDIVHVYLIPPTFVQTSPFLRFNCLL